MDKIVMWSLFIIPWLSLFFLDRTAIRKYMPVALFVTVINTILNQLAWTYNWWKFEKTLFAWDRVIPLFTVYGIFLVGTIWIFTFTFRRFWLYMLINFFVDLLYGFGLAALLTNFGIRSKGTAITPLQNLSLMLFLAVVIYVYQLWQEGMIGGKNDRGENETDEIKWKSGFRIGSKMKAK